MGVGLAGLYKLQTFFWFIVMTNWRVYNSIANTGKGVLFLPPSDAYVRSFLYLLYTLIKLYYRKALSDQASSLAPDWILLLQRPRILASFRGSATTFHYCPRDSQESSPAPQFESIDSSGHRKKKKALLSSIKCLNSASSVYLLLSIAQFSRTGT